MGLIWIQSGFLFLGMLLLWQALRWLRLIRKLEDTPTAKIGSAAQGFVQLAGLARPQRETPLHVPVLQVPCVWYRYERYDDYGAQDDDAEPVEVQQSQGRFRLVDRSGECIVEPYGAEIVARKQKQWHDGDGGQHKAWWIGVGEHVNAVGWFHSLHPMPVVDDRLPGATAGGAPRRYGQLRRPEHHLIRPPHGHLPFFIGASHEPYLVRRLRRELYRYLAASLAVGVLIPGLIAFLNR